MKDEELLDEQEQEELSDWYPTLTELYEYNGMSISDFI